MVDVRTRSLLGLVVGVSACFVENPLFDVSGAGGTGGTTTSGPMTTGDPGTSDASDASDSSTTTSSSSTTDASTSTTAAAPVCGDGNKDPGEQCDDGNLMPGDGCEPNCRPLFRTTGKQLEGSQGAQAIAVADLNNDVFDDLLLGFPACGGDQPCARGWHGREDGTFEQIGDFALPAPPSRLFAGDWVVDQHADILATHAGDGFVTLLAYGQMPVEFAMMGDLSAAIVTDINGDALPDLVVPDQPASKIHYAIANGVGFAEPVEAPLLYPPRRLAGADVDGDQATDLLYTIHANGTGFAVKPGVLGPEVGPFTSLTAPNATPLVVGEFATQPWPNVAYADPVQETLQIFSNDGNAQFSNASYTVTTKGGALVLRSVRLNTSDVDNIVALTTMGLQVFTYNKSKGEVGAGTVQDIAGLGIDFVTGTFGDDPRPEDRRTDIAVLTQSGCFILLNQTGA